MSITIVKKSETKRNVEKFFDFSNKVGFAWKYQELFVSLLINKFYERRICY